MSRETLSGHTVIVMGAGHGVGAAASRALSTAGANVVLAASDGQSVEAMTADINSTGGHAVAVPTDPISAVSVRRLVEQTLGAFGRLDAAINNTSISEASLAMKYEIPSIRRTGGGCVVNLAGPLDTHAILELTRSTALNYVDARVRINAVTTEPPGSVEDIASIVVWLCSADASLVTGRTLHVLPRRLAHSLD